jgi:hypothetical protein
VPIETLKSHISRGNDQIPAESIMAGDITICYKINKLLILFGKKKNCTWSGRSRILKEDETDFSNYRGVSLLSITYKITLLLLPN